MLKKVIIGLILLLSSNSYAQDKIKVEVSGIYSQNKSGQSLVVNQRDRVLFGRKSPIVLEINGIYTIMGRSLEDYAGKNVTIWGELYLDKKGRFVLGVDDFAPTKN